MKVDFDKFNLSQKIYSVFGSILAIIVYMNDEDYLNIALGIALLTIIVVFLMRYNVIKRIINIALAVGVFIGIYFLYDAHQSEKMAETKQIDWTLLPDQARERDLSIRLDQRIDRMTQDYFCIGSTKEKVRRVQGEPDHIDGNRWNYGGDNLWFNDDGTVKSFTKWENVIKVKYEGCL